jgi:hypothetical protein
MAMGECERKQRGEIFRCHIYFFMPGSNFLKLVIMLL